MMMGSATSIVKEREFVLSSSSVTVTLIVKLPTAVGAPVIDPLDDMERPDPDDGLAVRE